MFDAISILIVAGTFLVLLWLSLVLARFLLSAILLSMQRGTCRELETMLVPTLTKLHLNPKTFIGEPRKDSHRR